MQIGPLTIREVGNEIIFESAWDDPSKHADFITEWMASKPKIKATIDERITRLLEIIAKFDPIHLLSFVSLECGFDKIHESGEMEHAEDFVAEYALGLCSAIPFETPREEPDESALREFLDLLRGVFNDVSLYFGIELAAAAAEEKPLIDLRVQALLKFLFQRGDTHRYYQYPFIRSLYHGYDEFFRERFGLSLDETLSEIEAISSSSQIKVRKQHEIVGKFKEAVTLVGAALDDGRLRAGSIEELRQRVNALPEIKEVLPDPAASGEKLRQNPFEIDIASPQQNSVLERLAIPFGKNRDFAEFEKSPGWPTNSGEHTKHPIIAHEGRYYAFVPQMIWRNLREIFDAWIAATDSKYFKQVVFDPKRETGRPRWLERRSLHLLGQLLPGSRVHPNLFYPDQGLGNGKRREIDGLIEYDGNVIIVSAKSGEWSVAARRGALTSMAEEIGRLVVEGFEQGDAAKRYVELPDNAVFTNEAGATKVEFTADSKPRAIYLINVTLSPLGPAAIQLNALKAVGLLPQEQFAWSVSVNDLQVIADICESPSEFLFYLQRRLRFNSFAQLRGADELDLFGYFLDQGLFFDEGRLEGVSVFSIGPNTDNIDRYLDELERSVSNPKKPRLAISRDFRALIQTIERCKCEGFSEIALYLLNLDGSYHEQISAIFASLRESVQKDGRCHHATIAIGEDVGLTVELRGEDAKAESVESRYCLLKKYQLKVPTWLFVSARADLEPSTEDHAAIFKGEWSFDSEMEAQLERFRAHKLERATSGGVTIRRNQQCPCGSGLKFKRCCGRQTV